MTTVTQVTEKLVTFARLVLGRKAITDAIESAADFVGCEVIAMTKIDGDKRPFYQRMIDEGSIRGTLDAAGDYIYDTAIITDVEWDSTVLPAGWQKGQPEGDWCIKVRYIATGWESWTSQTDLMLTGTRYEDIEAVIQRACDTQAQMRMEVSHE